MNYKRTDKMSISLTDGKVVHKGDIWHFADEDGTCYMFLVVGFLVEGLSPSKWASTQVEILLLAGDWELAVPRVVTTSSDDPSYFFSLYELLASGAMIDP